MATKSRKLDHLQIALKKKVEFRGKSTGFEKVELNYACLPEIDFDEVNTETSFLGHKLNAPLMVEAVTGGCKEAVKINKDIAKACENLGLAMGLGSQRAMLEDSRLNSSYQVRSVAPKIFLAGNIGAVQLKHYSVEEIARALEEVQANALAIHGNAAQEAVQKDGTTDFSNCLNFIDKVSRNLSLPVIFKEVGCGISKQVASALAQTKVAAIDVAGAGGTSWTGIEYLRNGVTKEEEQVFWDFGIPTMESLMETKQFFSGPIIASGGIRSGLDVVKALSLGASLGGIALPVLKAQAKGGSKGVENYLSRIMREIKLAMFLIGAKTIKDV
jgi:isopentenyl-diphosphate delta-isomerase